MKILISFILLWTMSSGESKIALLLGNSTYSKNSLNNPTNDVDLLEEKLKDLGFTVYKGKNLSRSKMITKLRSFYNRVDSNTIALIYFSGHGVNSSLDGKNYLIPIGGFAELMNESQLSDVAIADSYVLGSTNGAKFSILLLDACRSNDFAQVRGDKGLGQPKSGLGNDYIISYATDVGKTAEDGYKNSPYALALSNHMLGNYPIEELFRRVRKEVSKNTNGKQKPLYKPSFSERLCLSGNCGEKSVESSKIIELEAQLTALKEKQKESKYSKPKISKKKIQSKHITTIDDLMWQDESYTTKEESAYNDSNIEFNGKVLTWDKGITYCKDLALGGYTDWRLPSKEELTRLYQLKSRLKNVEPSDYWSSTTYVGSSGNVWYVNFYDGKEHGEHHFYSLYIRCVRARQ